MSSQSTDETHSLPHGDFDMNHYNDYSCYTEEMFAEKLGSDAKYESAGGSCNNTRVDQFRRRASDAFPFKLHMMLATVEEANMDSIVSWQPHGRAFKIHDQTQFCEIVLPQFFPKIKFRSFQRQLNIYSFCRLTHGRDANSFYHELFLRGRTYLVKGMVRSIVKGGKKRILDPIHEPNLYSMPPIKASNVDDSKDAAESNEAIESTKVPSNSTPEDFQLQRENSTVQSNDMISEMLQFAVDACNGQGFEEMTRDTGLHKETKTKANSQLLPFDAFFAVCFNTISNTRQNDLKKNSSVMSSTKSNAFERPSLFDDDQLKRRTNYSSYSSATSSNSSVNCSNREKILNILQDHEALFPSPGTQNETNDLEENETFFSSILDGLKSMEVD